MDTNAEVMEDVNSNLGPISEVPDGDIDRDPGASGILGKPILSDKIALTPAEQEAKEEAEDPGFFEAFEASVYQESVIVNDSYLDFDAEPGYSPYDDPENIRGFDPMAFVRSTSPGETEVIKSKTLQERVDRETIDAYGGLPGFAAEVAGTIVGQPYLMLPQFFASRFVPIVAMEMTAEAVNETILQYQQYERPVVESALNVVAVGIFGGIMEGVKYGVTKASMDKGVQAVEKIIETDFPEDVPNYPSQAMTPEKGSVGAAMVSPTIEGETLVGGKIAEKMSVGTMARMMTSPDVEVRVIAQQMADNPLLTKKNLSEISSGVSAETKVHVLEGRLAKALQQEKSQFDKYHKAGGKMSRDEFGEATSRDLSYPSPNTNAQVRAAADGYRVLYDDYKTWAVDSGRFPKDIKAKFAHGFQHRVWDRQKLIKLSKTFIKEATDYFENGIRYGSLVKISIGKYRMAVPISDVPMYKRMNPGLIVETKIPDATQIRQQASEIAEELHRNMVNRNASDVPIRGLVTEAGAMKPRVLGFTDAQAEKYLERRASRVATAFSREMSVDRALYDKLGSPDLDDVMDKLAKNHQRLVDKAPESKKLALQKRLESDRGDVLALRDIVAHKYGRPAEWTAIHSAGAVMRMYTNATSLGGVLYTSLSDMAMPIMRYGLSNVAGGVHRLLTDHANLSKATKTEIGIGIQNTISARYRGFGEMSEEMGLGQPKWLEGLGKLQNNFFTATLLPQWTDFMQRFSTEVASGAAIKWMRGGTKKQKAMLARGGIDWDISEKILREYDRTGTLNPRDWEHGEAADVWEGFLNFESRNVVIEPGAGDRFRWMHTEGGRFIGQFRNFQVAAHNKMLIAGLQQSDASFYSGLVVLMALAGLIAEGKDAVRGNDSSDEVMDKVLNSMDRSGMMGVVSIPVMAGYKMAGGTPSRRVSQELSGAVFGPNFGKIERVISTGMKSAEGKAKVRDWMFLIPGTNLHHIKDLATRVAEN